MNTLTKLSILTFAIAVTACNEKVSPELQSGNAASSTTTSSGGSSSSSSSSYYFRVVNKSDTMLNYRLHRTGSGKAATNCEITSTTDLSSNSYRADPSTYDITCFYEMEELSLWYNGFDMAIEASANSCQYIGYSPFSYYDRQPGNSSQSLVQVKCAEGDAQPNQAQIDAAVPGLAGIPCNGYRNVSVNPTGSFSLASDRSICSFDYSASGGPNCDEGTVTISGVTLTRIDTDSDGNYDATTSAPFMRTVSCGGKAVNCIDGAIMNVSSIAGKYSSNIVVGQTKKDTAYSETYKNPNVFTTYPSNRRYVNYRRDLASLDIEFGNSNRNSWTTDLSSAYMSSFGDPLYKYSYNPELMAMYALNKRMDGTTLVSTTNQTNASILNGNYVAKPLAAEPYIGMGAGYRTSPYYTMYCFDNAFDVKARIRIVVRDWDRVFSTSATDTSFERISDVDLLPPYAKQDVPYTEELTGDPDSWNDFNDVGDWDDLIDMERDDAGISYDPSITVWRTYPVAPYDQPTTNGFFNPQWFPSERP